MGDPLELSPIAVAESDVRVGWAKAYGDKESAGASLSISQDKQQDNKEMLWAPRVPHSWVCNSNFHARWKLGNPWVATDLLETPGNNS